MFIIIFQYISTGKTEVSEERFIQNDNTNFLSNTSFFIPEIVLFIKLRKPLYLPKGYP